MSAEGAGDQHSSTADSNESSVVSGNSLIRSQEAEKMADEGKAQRSQPFNVVFVLGPPGSGKGTQCQQIEKKIGFVHLSAGELLRAEQQRPGSEFGQLIDDHIRSGTIVPVRITCSLLERAMEQQALAKGFLIDGFPRNQDNMDGWRSQMAGKVRELFVLYINAPIEVCVQRCLKRGQGRTDDNEESIRRRITTYNSQTMPIIQHFQSLHMVHEIDAGTKNAEEVYAMVEKIFRSFDTSSSTQQSQQ